MGHRKTRRRRGLASATGAVALLALALLAPTVAQAHTGAATVSCTGADFSFTRFQPGSNTVHWIVTVDNQTAASGDYTLDQNGGSSGSLHVPLSIGAGTHYVKANAWWGPAGVVGNETRSKYAPPLAKTKVYCETPPTPPTPPSPPSPPAPPSPPVTPPSTPATPPATPAAPPAAAAPAPGGAVQGVQTQSPARGVAGVKVARSCASRSAQVTVRGRSMRSVTLFVNGRKIRTVRVRSGAQVLHARVPIINGRKQVVSARVTFSNGARARTLTHSAVRCSAAAVRPQFTG
jgi:hypothetical protein